MNEKRERILKIRKKILDYNRFILEYGFNPERDIFINEDITSILEELEELEKEINNEE
jgi:hypothetical protein